MTDINKLIADNIDVWSGAIEKRKSNGRGSSSKIKLVGINNLRKLILELAVQGRLVPQNEKDEDVSKFLQKITLQRNLLIAEKKIKQHKALPAITKGEQPFAIPDSWSYQRFGDVMFNRDGERKPVSASERKGMQGQYDYYGASGVIDQVNDYLFEKTLLLIGEDGANLLSRTTPIAFLAHGKYWVNNHAHVLDGIHTDFLEFIALHINAISLEDYVTGTAQPKMNQAKMNSIVLAIPPEEEQKRITSKVNDLMALCDQLEQQTEASIDAHQQLIEELLSTLTNSENAQDFEQNWARIAEHFDLLFTTEHSIEQLKQTILQLAVMGKLVPQDPSDEPASELLKRIAQEKEQLIKDKAIKKEKALPALTEEEKPFELPNGWALARVGNLVSKLGSGSTPRGGKAAYVTSGVPFLRSQNVWNDGIKTDDIAYIPEDTHNSMSNTKVYPNDVLLNITGASLGRATIFPTELKEANVSQHVTIIRLIEKEMSEFVLLGIHSPMIQSLVWDRQVGVAIEGLSKKVLELFEFPIPPLPEQKRIISKVHSLMALCEQLKANINAAKSTQIYLAETIVEKALGRNPVIKLEDKEENKAMKISTELSLGSVTYDTTAILAPLIGENGADAKSVWSKSGLKLPDFYRQLKSEITAGFVAKPAKAEFEG